MTKSLAVITACLLSIMVAAAQDTPKAEVFLGYTYVRANSAHNLPAFSANGGGGQFAYDFNKWIAFVADLGAVHNGNIGGAHLDTTFMNFLFGPRVPIRNHSRFTPYGQVLWGGVYATSSALVVAVPFNPTPVATPGLPFSARIGGSQTAFAMTLGGGLDIRINKHVSFRPIGLDWYLTRLQNLRSQDDNNQHNLRYTAGLNFTFGAR